MGAFAVVVAAGSASPSLRPFALLATIAVVGLAAVSAGVFTVGQALFTLTILTGVLPALPGLADAARSIGVPLLAPLGLAWFALSIRGQRFGRGVPIAAVLIVIGFLGTDEAPEVFDTWVGAVVLPLLLFVGLQALPQNELSSARVALRYVLFAACAAQVFFYVAAVGPNIFSPTFVLGNRTNVVLWQDVGSQVLGNPNNAAVIYCTAFAWALTERATKQASRFSPLFAGVAGLAVWCTGSRGAIIVALLTLLLASGLSPRRHNLPLRVLGVAALAILAVNYWKTTFGSAGEASLDNSFQSRMDARLAAVGEVFSRPFGTGPGTTSEALQGALANVFRTGGGATSHDMFLNWGVSLGWVGLLVLVYALAVGVYTAIRAQGVLNLLPLGAFVLAAQSAGIDLLTVSNPAWSVVFWTLLGLAWRGSVMPPAGERPANAASPISRKAAAPVSRPN